MVKQSLAAFIVTVLLSSVSHAELTQSFVFNGNGNWSIDGIGGNSGFIGTIDANVPANSTVVKAFLYSTTNGVGVAPGVDFDGTVYQGPAFTPLGVLLGQNLTLQAFRADVTAQVATKVGSGGGTFSFNVNAENSDGALDGEMLAIVYSNPSEQVRTIAFLDGFSDSQGDQFAFQFAEPIDLAAPGFEALMSLGIGFSFQNSANPTNEQFSIVTVDGRALTSSAGGQDDGEATDGALITVGGIGDNPANPNPTSPPNQDPRTDDELYNLALGNLLNSAPYLTQGAAAFNVTTLNPSNDDNIFFVGVNVTAEGIINPVPVPEPSSIVLACASGLAGLVFWWRRRRA